MNPPRVAVQPCFDESAAPVVRAIPLDSAQEWRNALEGIPHSFFHTWEHCHAMFLSTGQPTYLFCAEAAGVRVVCPFVERSIGDRVDVATPYGFSGFAGNGVIPLLAEHWRRFAIARGYVCAFINLHPLFSSPQHSEPESLFAQKELYILDATMGVEALLGACSRGRRRELRQWEGEATICTDRSELKAFLLAHHRDFFRRKNAFMAYDFSSRTMEFLLEQENVLLIGAGRGAGLEAVNAFACTPWVAEGLFNFSFAQGCHHSAGLIWEALLQIQRMGIPFFNLGGGLYSGDSLARFKSRLGATPNMGYAIKQVLDAICYTELCLRRGVDPADRTGYFPAYRALERSHTIDV